MRILFAFALLMGVLHAAEMDKEAAKAKIQAAIKEAQSQYAKGDLTRALNHMESARFLMIDIKAWDLIEVVEPLWHKYYQEFVGKGGGSDQKWQVKTKAVAKKKVTKDWSVFRKKGEAPRKIFNRPRNWGLNWKGFQYRRTGIEKGDAAKLAKQVAKEKARRKMSKGRHSWDFLKKQPVGQPVVRKAKTEGNKWSLISKTKKTVAKTHPKKRPHWNWNFIKPKKEAKKVVKESRQWRWPFHRKAAMNKTMASKHKAERRDWNFLKVKKAPDKVEKAAKKVMTPIWRAQQPVKKRVAKKAPSFKWWRKFKKRHEPSARRVVKKYMPVTEPRESLLSKMSRNLKTHKPVERVVEKAKPEPKAKAVQKPMVKEVVETRPVLHRNYRRATGTKEVGWRKVSAAQTGHQELRSAYRVWRKGDVLTPSLPRVQEAKPVKRAWRGWKNWLRSEKKSPPKEVKKVQQPVWTAPRDVKTQSHTPRVRQHQRWNPWRNMFRRNGHHHSAGKASAPANCCGHMNHKGSSSRWRKASK